jgi:hypothetical protein
MIQRGIRKLESYVNGCLGIAPDEHTVYGGFPLGRWWTRILTEWTHPAIRRADRQRIADLITWLSVSRQHHQRIRRDLSVLTGRPVVDHVHAFATSRSAPWGIDDLARWNVIGSRAALDTERVHRALTFEGMPVERQAEILLDVLHRAGYEVYRRQFESDAFVNGFHDGLEEYPRNCPVEATPARIDSSISACQYVAGWEYASEFGSVILTRREAAVTYVTTEPRFPTRSRDAGDLRRKRRTRGPRDASVERRARDLRTPSATDH